MSHPKVKEAAVIGIPRPEVGRAAAGLRRGQARARTLTAEEVLEHLTPLVAKWWLPDAVEFIDEVPKTSVGKFSKKDLRTRSPTTSSPERARRREFGEPLAPDWW